MPPRSQSAGRAQPSSALRPQGLPKGAYPQGCKTRPGLPPGEVEPGRWGGAWEGGERGRGTRAEWGEGHWRADTLSTAINSGCETWAGRPTPQTLNPGWAFLEPTPGVTPPYPHAYPSQPQTPKAPQVEQTAPPRPAPHEGAGHCLARPRPLQAPGQGPRMTHLLPPTLGPWDARGFDQYLSV